MRKVFVAVPSHTGEPTKQTKATLDLIALECEANGWGHELFMWRGDSLITHARNVVLAKFLKSQADDLFCLDDDVACGPGVFSRLMTHRVDFVCGLYRMKKEPEEYAVVWPEGERWSDDATGLLEAQYVPFGFVRLSRACVRAMVEKEKDRWFTPSCAPELRCYPVFEEGPLDRRWWGEDFTFCRKWRELGGKVWVDPEIPLIHVQGETLYRGNAGAWLRSRL